MIYIIWMLLILFALVLALCISILLYHPKTKTENKAAVPSSAANTEEKEEPVSYQNAGKMQMSDLVMYFPELKIYMKEELLDHGILLHWKGASACSSHVLLSLHNDACRHACLEAVQRIYEDNELPENDFYLCLPYTEALEKEASEECRTYLRDQGIHIKGVLMDGSDNEDLLHHARLQALIGTGTGAYAEISVNGNPRRTQRWIENLRAEQLLPLQTNASLSAIVSSLHEQIPFLLRCELLFSAKKGLRDLLEIMPDSWIWMRASIEKKKDSLILRAPEQAMIQEAVRILEVDASHNSLYLKEERTLMETRSSDKEDWIYQRTSSLIADYFDVQGIVPVPIAEAGSLGHYDEWKTVRYMPLNKNKNESKETMIHFYQSFLTKV
jgi:hypothetical protein